MKYIVTLVLSLLCSLGYCQEHVEETNHTEVANHPHQDNVEVYVGVTYNDIHKTNLFTIGLDYEHRFRWLDYRIGISLLTDYEFGHMVEASNHRVNSELLITPVVNFYPSEQFKLFVGGGMLFTQEEQKGVSRLGTGYEFEIHHTLLIIPSIAVDLAKDYRAYLLGVSLGIGFH